MLVRVHVVTNDAVPHLSRAHRKRQTHVALAGDDHMHDSSW